MSVTADIGRWTRRLGQLRASASKLQRGKAPDDEESALLQEALATCDTLLQDLAGAQLALERMQADCRAEISAHEDLLRRMPLASLTTDAEGNIVELNEAAAVLLNTSAKGLYGRRLVHFIDDREAFNSIWRSALVERARVTSVLVLRPRERAPRPVQALIEPALSQNPAGWTWFLLPENRGELRARDLRRAPVSEERQVSPEEGVPVSAR